jgi:hypothetical protein
VCAVKRCVHKARCVHFNGADTASTGGIYTDGEMHARGARQVVKNAAIKCLDVVKRVQAVNCRRGVCRRQRAGDAHIDGETCRRLLDIFG